MKKILALNNIGTIQSVYADSTSRDVAYTPKLLELNVIIDFKGVPIVNQKDFQEETNVFATIHRDGKLHTYNLFSSDEIMGPLIISRLIIDAIEFIETCDKDDVIEQLKEIASEYFVIDESTEFYKITRKEYFDAINMISKSLENLS
jgi:hypothetical protein